MLLRHDRRRYFGLVLVLLNLLGELLLLVHARHVRMVVGRLVDAGVLLLSMVSRGEQLLDGSQRLTRYDRLLLLCTGYYRVHFRLLTGYYRVHFRLL